MKNMKKLLALLLVVLSVHYIYATTQETSGINQDQSYWEQYFRHRADSIRKDKNGKTMKYIEGNEDKEKKVEFFDENGKAKKINKVEVYQNLPSTEVLTCREVADLVPQITDPLNKKIRDLGSTLETLVSETKVDSILNIEDASIFDQIKNVKEEDVLLRSKDFYNLVKMISDLRDLLENVKLENANVKLEEANQLIDDVNLYEGPRSQGLTDEQKRVFAEQVEKYNEKMDLINGLKKDY